MNFVAAPVRARPFALRVHADALAVAAVGAVVVVLAAVTWNTWGDLGRDTGYDFVAAARVAHGQMPYSDFVYYYGPLAPFALGLAALLGGAGVGTFVAVGLVLTAAIVAATYALARSFTGPTGAALAASGTAAVAFSPTNLSFVVPHTYSESFAILLALLFLIGLARSAEGSMVACWSAGVAAGLVALTRPEFEVAVAFAGVVWLVARHRGGTLARRQAIALIAPAVAVPVLVYGAYLFSVSPHRLFLENLYPVSTLHAGGSAIIRAQAPLTPHSIVVVLGYLVLYAVGAAALLVAARGLNRLGPRGATAVVLASAAAVLAVASVDPELIRTRLQWVFGGIPAAAALATAVLVWRHVVRRRPVDASTATLLASVTVLAVVAAKTYSGFFFLAARAQPAVYTAPLVFALLARLHLVELPRNRAAVLAGTAWIAVLVALCAGLTVKDARAQSATVAGPGGSIRVTPAEAPLYRAALGAIAAGTRPGEPIVIAPQLSGLYTLSGRTDPLPQISLVPGALPSRSAELAAVGELERAHVRFAITDRHEFREYGQSTFGGSFDRVLAGWIRRHLNHVSQLRPQGGVDHTLDVWARRGS